MTGKWKPNDSNTLLKTIFGEGGAFQEEFEKGKLWKPKNRILHAKEAIIGSKKDNVYVIRARRPIVLKGVTEEYR